jgi:hypothetical protein
MSETTGRETKVERVIAEYDLDGVGDELEVRWLGENGERESLRDLADWFNQRVLASALERNGSNPLDGEAENVYRILRGDDASPGMKTSARRQMERDGVDAETLERDFVSHQAIHTYLRDRRGAELPSDDDRASSEAETIRKLRSRATAVTENSLERLRGGDEIDLGGFDVFTQIQVLCADCGSQYDAVELIERGGCDCTTRDESG